MSLVNSLSIIYTIILIGFLAGKFKLFNDIQIEGFELFLFKIAIPCYLFNAVLTTNFSQLININYIYSYLLSFLVIAIIITVYFGNCETLSGVCIKILASGYVNAAIYTLPVITFILGDPTAAILGNLIQVVAIQPVFLTILSFIKHREKSIIHRVFKILVNPLVLAPVIAISLHYSKLGPSLAITTVAKYLGNSATSMALFAFGLNINSIKISHIIISKEILVILIAKNILHPLAAILIGRYLFKLENYWLYSLIIAASAPTAFLVYIMAKQFSIQADFIRLIVAVSSFVSLISLIVIYQFIA
jgi:malonate transporter and related proteins